MNLLAQRVEALESRVDRISATRESIEETRAWVEKMLSEPPPDLTPEEEMAKMRESLSSPATGPNGIWLQGLLEEGLRKLEDELNVPEGERFVIGLSG